MAGADRRRPSQIGLLNSSGAQVPLDPVACPALQSRPEFVKRGFPASNGLAHAGNAHLDAAGTLIPLRPRGPTACMIVRDIERSAALLPLPCRHHRSW